LLYDTRAVSFCFHLPKGVTAMTKVLMTSLVMAVVSSTAIAAETQKISLHVTGAM
jgi:hypothetical protein